MIEVAAVEDHPVGQRCAQSLEVWAAELLPLRHHHQRVFGERDGLELCDSANAALVGADALVVVTEWKQFRSPDFDRLRAALADRVIFDGRNLYHPDEVEAAELAYYGIGRGRSVASLD